MTGENRQKPAKLTAHQARYLAALITSPRLQDAARLADVSERQARRCPRRRANCLTFT